jgi:hypothetical protein
MIKNLLAVLLITYGVLGNGMFDLLDRPTPTPTPELPMVDIDRPSAEVIAVVDPIAAIINETSDRVEIALYFLELSQRLTTYPTLTLQQLNDLVIHSATEVFDGRLTGKYKGFDEALVKVIVGIAGEVEHELTPKEKQELSSIFEGLAWSLVQIKK